MLWDSKEECNKAVLFAFLFVLSGFLELHGTYCWDERRARLLARSRFYFYRLVQCLHVSKLFFIYCLLGWTLMESAEQIGVEERALCAAIRSHYPRTPLPSISLSSSPWLSFILHPAHLPPACQHLHNWASICLPIALFPTPASLFPPQLPRNQSRPARHCSASVSD